MSRRRGSADLSPRPGKHASCVMRRLLPSQDVNGAQLSFAKEVSSPSWQFVRSFVVVVVVFFPIARGSLRYTLRFSNICLQGDVSLPNRWPSFSRTHHPPNIERAPFHIRTLRVCAHCKNSPLWLNLVYSKHSSGCGKCHLVELVNF